MKTKSAEKIEFNLDPNNLPPLTKQQAAELSALAGLPDAKIDYTEIGVMSDEKLKGMHRGEFYRPVKQQITARVDADVVHWLKAQGKGYQARMNAILRREMLASLGAKGGKR